MLLAIPMIIEMGMESVFALVDLYFVGRLPDSEHNIQTVGLTESVLSLVYSLGFGFSMAATALIARRVGEKDPKAASHAALQSIWLTALMGIVLSIIGYITAPVVLQWMGAEPATVRHGAVFALITRLTTSG